MVGTVEPVGDQELDLLPRRGALDVAGNDAEVGRGDELGVVQQSGQRRARHHRFQPGQGARVGALLDHREQELERVGEGGLAQGLAGEEVQHRQPAVEPAGGERGAARRAGHAHEAGDADLADGEFADEFGEGGAVGVVSGVALLEFVRRQRQQAELVGDRAVGGEQLREAGLVELRRHALALAEAQQLADQAAARMADQMQLRALGQAAHKRERIGHRAFGEAAVLEGEGAPGVGGGQAGAGVAAGGVVGSPQLAEAALRAGGGAVQQDQQRLRGGRQQRLVRERGEGEGAVQAQGVQAGFAAFELAVLEPASELGGGLFLDADAEELEHADAQPERAALAAAGVGRGGREAVVPRVAQQRIELPRVAAIARQAAPAVFAHQRVGTRP